MRLAFMGSPAFAVPTLRRLVESEHEVVAVYTQPDRQAGRGRTLTPPPAKEWALAHGLTVRQPRRVSAPDAVEELAALEPDCIVIAAYGQILKQPVLDVPPRHVLNVHASLLPRHRGAAPIAAAILAGDAETGVTIMQVELALDSGPILAARAVPITDHDTTGSLTERLAEAGADLLMEVLPDWLSGTLEPRLQDDSLATYAPPVQKEDALIDWSLSAVEIWRRVRAYSPWPVAFTTLRDQQLRILEAWPLAGDAGDGPGAVVPCPSPAGESVAAEAAFAVQTGEGLLAVLRVQRAGRRAMTSADFLRGERDLMGRRLG
jgi:methionyl-tRNA formyltransferase